MAKAKSKIAAKNTAQEAPITDPSPSVELEKPRPLKESIASDLQRVVSDLAAIHAAEVVRLSHKAPANKRQPTVLVPLGEKAEARLMAFAEVAAQWERTACLDIAKRFVTPEVGEQIARAMVERGTLKRWMSFWFDEASHTWDRMDESVSIAE